MEDLVAVAIFTFPNEASVLESLLQSEGITYFMQSEGACLVMPPLSTGGLTLVVKSADVPRTVELIKRDGYGQYLANNQL